MQDLIITLVILITIYRAIEAMAQAYIEKKCPYCTEKIPKEATVCKFCHKEQKEI
jgi:hypothetical protein